MQEQSKRKRDRITSNQSLSSFSDLLLKMECFGLWPSDTVKQRKKLPSLLWNVDRPLCLQPKYILHIQHAYVTGDIYRLSRSKMLRNGASCTICWFAAREIIRRDSERQRPLDSWEYAEGTRGKKTLKAGLHWRDERSNPPSDRRFLTGQKTWQ